MNDELKEFFGWMLMIIGGLFVLLTGGCSLLFMTQLSNPYVDFSAIILFAGIPFLVGCGLFAWGRSLLPR